MINRGLVLSGGGARGAYQAGVLNGISAILRGMPHQTQCPFQIITGISAGAINAAFIAANCDEYTGSITRLAELWSEIHSHDVFRTDPWSLGRIGMQLALDVVSGGSRFGRHTQGLLDTAPLAHLLLGRIHFEKIREHMASGILNGIAVSATNYATNECISFYESSREILPWQRSRRRGIRRPIDVTEIMASAAIPLLFPPIKVGQEFYGDGCLRNGAPLSPALHLGVNRLVVIGVRKTATVSRQDQCADADTWHKESGAIDDESIVNLETKPNFGRILSVIINAIMLDAVESDVERLARINQTLNLLTDKARQATTLRHVDWLYIHPSDDIGQIAMEEAHSMPRILGYLVAGLGDLREASDLVSYLLFEPAFINRLLQLGYQDAMSRRDEIEEFFS